MDKENNMTVAQVRLARQHAESELMKAAQAVLRKLYEDTGVCPRGLDIATVVHSNGREANDILVLGASIDMGKL